MLRLQTTRSNTWLDLPHGVRVEVRPLTTAVTEAALAEAQKRSAAEAVEAETASAAGQPLDPLGLNGGNAAWLTGQRLQWYVEALARYGIVAWEGLADADGAPLAVTPAAIEAFAAHPDLAKAFLTEYGASLHRLAAEGNASAPTSGGEPAEAGASAPAATGQPGPASPDEAPQAETAAGTAPA
jgi:hypothetical protein